MTAQATESNALVSMLDAAGALLRCQDPRELVDAIARRVCKAVECDVFFSYLVDEDASGRRYLKLNCWMGIPEASLPHFMTYEFDVPVCGIVARSGRECFAGEAIEAAGGLALAETSKAMGLRAYACFPVMGRGRVIGTLGYGTTRRPSLAEQQIEMMRSSIAPLSIALDRLLTETELRAARDAAEAAGRAKDRFLAVLSHELRTPLTPVMGVLDLLRQHPGIPEDVMEDLAMIRRNIFAESKLIDDLLDVARFSQGKIKLACDAVDAGAVIRGVVDLVRAQADAKGVRLAVSDPQGRATVTGDALRLRQVLLNLVHNAVKFTPGGGTVSVSACNPSPEVLRIEVADNGIGLSEEDLERVFDPFEQASARGKGGGQGGGKNQRRPEGLGLGLAIARSLVLLHGGQVRASSEGEGCGATFTVELPLAARAEPVVGAAPLEVVLGNRQLSDLRVLMVEDHPDTQRFLGRALKLLGINVTAVATVKSAHDVLAAQPIDLIVSDIDLPDGSGLEFARAVRALAAHARTPLLAVSGFGSDEDRRRAFDAGFSDHLTKPVRVDDLERVVRRLAAAADAG